MSSGRRRLCASQSLSRRCDDLLDPHELGRPSCSARDPAARTRTHACSPAGAQRAPSSQTTAPLPATTTNASSATTLPHSSNHRKSIVRRLPADRQKPGKSSPDAACEGICRTVRGPSGPHGLLHPRSLAGPRRGPRGHAARDQAATLLALLVLNANETLGTDRLIGTCGEHPPTTALEDAAGPRLAPSQDARPGKRQRCGWLVVTRYRGTSCSSIPSVSIRTSSSFSLRRGSRTRPGSPGPRRYGARAGALAVEGATPCRRRVQSFAQREIARLADLRTAALEQLVEAQLELGRHEEVVTDSRRDPRAPLWERLRAQLMLALSAATGSGRAPGLPRCEEEPPRRAGHRAGGTASGAGARDPRAGPNALRAGRGGGRGPAGARRGHAAGRPRGRARLAARALASGQSVAGRLVLLAGAQGMGKTRLAAELARHVQLERGEVLYYDGRGAPGGGARGAGGRTRHRPVDPAGRRRS